MVRQSIPTYTDMLEHDIGRLHLQLAALRGELRAQEAATRNALAARDRAWVFATSCLPIVELFGLLIERDLIDREFMDMVMPHSEHLLATFATLQPGDAEPEAGDIT
jgi:hypothetical protein